MKFEIIENFDYRYSKKFLLEINDSELFKLRNINLNFNDNGMRISEKLAILAKIVYHIEEDHGETGAGIQREKN